VILSDFVQSQARRVFSGVGPEGGVVNVCADCLAAFAALSATAICFSPVSHNFKVERQRVNVKTATATAAKALMLSWFALTQINLEPY
jgi:hypothetical protein